MSDLQSAVRKMDPVPFLRDIARLFNRPQDITYLANKLDGAARARAAIVRLFGAPAVHEALRAARAAAAERETERLAAIRTAGDERCECRVCVIYGGDCTRALATSELCRTRYKWEARANRAAARRA